LKHTSPTQVPVAPNASPSKNRPSSRANKARMSLRTVDLRAPFSNYSDAGHIVSVKMLVRVGAQQIRSAKKRFSVFTNLTCSASCYKGKTEIESKLSFGKYDDWG